MLAQPLLLVLLVVGVNLIDEVDELVDNLLLLLLVVELLYIFFFNDAVSLLLLGVSLLFKGGVFVRREGIAGDTAELGVLMPALWDRPVRAVDIGDGSTGAFFLTVGEDDVATLIPAASKEETLRLGAFSLFESFNIKSN